MAFAAFTVPAAFGLDVRMIAELEKCAYVWIGA
jgi:hypothetical protein